VNVTIRATLNGEAVDETFSVTVKPNLISSIKVDPFSTITVPGDAGQVKLSIGNSGASTLQGQFNVKFYCPRSIWRPIQRG
jgi:hypothetical protein